MLNRFLLVVLLPFALAACEPQIMARGHLDVRDALKELKPGASDKAEVLRRLGTPSTRSSFGEETWYYITAQRQSRAFFKPETTDQAVTAVVFDQEGVVRDIVRHDKDAPPELAIVPKATPTEGQELGLWEQLLGNFGRFNTPRDRVNAPSAPGKPY
jgi:outer membrane protein assembly factor BamE (lipoprotein component of BamABCDE complex)